jgi:hypothetical protein
VGVSNGSRVVTGRIIHDNNLERMAHCTRRILERVESAPDKPLLIMRGDYKADHGDTPMSKPTSRGRRRGTGRSGVSGSYIGESLVCILAFTVSTFRHRPAPGYLRQL